MIRAIGPHDPPSGGEEKALRWARRMVACLQAILLGLLLRCAYLQLYLHDHYSAIQDEYVEGHERDPAPRGCIWTRHGEALARNVAAWRLGLDLVQAAGGAELPLAEREARVRDALAHVAQVIERYENPAGVEVRVLDRLAAGRRHAPLVSIDARADLDEIETLRLEWRRRGGPPCFTSDLYFRRDYAHGECALQVVGEIGAAGQGLFGIEGEYERFLAGQDGIRRLRRAGNRMVMEEVGALAQGEPGPARPAAENCAAQRESEFMGIEVAAAAGVPGQGAMPGSDVVLTIDLKAQLLLERLLGEALDDTGARRVLGVVIDPRTGAILAAACAPLLSRGEYALGLGTEDGRREIGRSMLNLRTAPYEPGSTIKPLILAEAIVRGLPLDTRITDGAKEWDMRPLGVRRTIRDSSSHGPLTMAESLIHSSNIGMVRIGLRLGREGLAAAVARFDLDPSGAWDKYLISSLPMGYQIAVTPWDLLRAYAAIANGGFRVEPYLVAAIAGAPTPAECAPQADEEARILPAAASFQLRALLFDAAVHGTGRGLDFERIAMAGKTGTAKIAGPGGYLPGEYYSSFMGFAPWREPRFLVFIHVDRPRGRYYGAQVAGPVARKMMGALLGVPGNRMAANLGPHRDPCDGSGSEHMIGAGDARGGTGGGEWQSAANR